MFKYTSAAITLLLTNLKKWCKGFQIALSLFTLVYLTFAIIAKIGIFPINVTLLVLFFLYTAYLTFFKKHKTEDAEKTVKHIYRIAKLALKAIPLATTLYTLWITSHNTNGLTIITTTLLLILWILQVLMEIVIFIIEINFKLFKSAFLLDIKWIIQLHDITHFEKDDWNIDFEELQNNVQDLLPIIKTKKDEKKQNTINNINKFIPPILHVKPKKVKPPKVKKVKVKKSPKNPD